MPTDEEMAETLALVKKHCAALNGSSAGSAAAAASPGDTKSSTSSAGSSSEAKGDEKSGGSSSGGGDELSVLAVPLNFVITVPAYVHDPQRPLNKEAPQPGRLNAALAACCLAAVERLLVS